MENEPENMFLREGSERASEVMGGVLDNLHEVKEHLSRVIKSAAESGKVEIERAQLRVLGQIDHEIGYFEGQITAIGERPNSRED